jgi:mannose-6-phosphate isomerase
VRPIHLEPNQLHRFYRGGARIAALRNSNNDDPYAPEEWIASMASPFAEPGVGISVLPDGRSLREAVRAAPEVYLGPAHVDRFGADVAVLIKLLDAGERLPVHFHPDDEFARAHLGSPYGKTEAWIILDAAPDAAVGVGFKEAIGLDEVRRWVDEQDVDAMINALHLMPVSAFDTLFVPAGTPHAIGEGILLAELQQPTDFSVLLEWEGFAIDGPNAGHLGLGFDLALQGLDRTPWGPEEIALCTSGRAAEDGPGIESLFPAEADAFFRAQRIESTPVSLEPSFSVLLVTDGRADLRGADWGVELARGDAVLVPYAAGECALEGDATIIRCLPPDPGSTS